MLVEYDYKSFIKNGNGQMLRNEERYNCCAKKIMLFVSKAALGTFFYIYNLYGPNN